MSGNSVTPNTGVSKSVNAATGAISTVLDLAKFNSGLEGAVLLHRETMDAMWSNAGGMPTGLGWFVQNYNGQTLYWQFGNTPGAFEPAVELGEIEHGGNGTRRCIDRFRHAGVRRDTVPAHAVWR